MENDIEAKQKEIELRVIFFFFLQIYLFNSFVYFASSDILERIFLILYYFEISRNWIKVYTYTDEALTWESFTHKFLSNFSYP